MNRSNPKSNLGCARGLAAVIGCAALLMGSVAVAEPSAKDMKEAQQLFQTVCSACHGASGKGDGPGAAALDPKPRDYTDAAWQKSTKDEAIAAIILKGGQAVGKSPLMPPAPQLEAKPGVLKGLVSIVRSFGQKKGKK